MVEEKRMNEKTMITDITVMEKHIAYPNDTALLDKVWKKIIQVIKKMRGVGITIPQKTCTYTRCAKQAVLMARKLGKGHMRGIERQMRCSVRCPKRLLMYL